MPTITAGVTLNSTTLFPNSSVVSFSATEVVSGSALFQYTVFHLALILSFMDRQLQLMILQQFIFMLKQQQQTQEI